MALIRIVPEVRKPVMRLKVVKPKKVFRVERAF